MPRTRNARSAPLAVTLRKPLARTLRQGHPWVYRDALAAAPPAPSGSVVEVRDRDRHPLALGFWDARSPIAVRVLVAGGEPRPQGRGAIEGLLRERLRRALAARLARLDRAQTDAFRWVHGEGDRLPGIHVDLYGDVGAVRHDGEGARAFYGPPLQGWLRDTAAAHGIRLRSVVDRERRDESNVGEVEVRENGVRFRVDLRHGQKGGLFLDQRENRAEVGRRAAGRRVLNLFGYTGGFSLYAALGGARSTDTVDLARPALEAARANFVLNGLPLEQAGFHAADAFAFLTDAARRGESWDLVVSDPPSFAPSQRALEAARRAYRRLHALAAAVVAPGGLFCPASCSSHLSRADFLASVEEGVAAAGRRFVLEELRGAGFDHPALPGFPEGDYLKLAIGRVE